MLQKLQQSKNSFDSNFFNQILNEFKILEDFKKELDKNFINFDNNNKSINNYELVKKMEKTLSHNCNCFNNSKNIFSNKEKINERKNSFSETSEHLILNENFEKDNSFIEKNTGKINFELFLEKDESNKYFVTINFQNSKKNFQIDESKWTKIEFNDNKNNRTEENFSYLNSNNNFLKNIPYTPNFSANPPKHEKKRYFFNNLETFVKIFNYLN